MTDMTVEQAYGLLRAAESRLDVARAHLANTPAGVVRVSDAPTEAWKSAVEAEAAAEANVRLWEGRVEALESQDPARDARNEYDRGFDAGYRAGYKDGRGSL